MTIAQEEIFGPVLAIMPYDDEDEALRIANDSIYGLSGGVQSADVERAKAFARKMRTGQVNINEGAYNLQAPFGGYKQSGNGRELGKFGLEEFLETKSMQLPWLIGSPGGEPSVRGSGPVPASGDGQAGAPSAETSNTGIRNVPMEETVASTSTSITTSVAAVLALVAFLASWSAATASPAAADDPTTTTTAPTPTTDPGGPHDLAGDDGPARGHRPGPAATPHRPAPAARRAAAAPGSQLPDPTPHIRVLVAQITVMDIQRWQGIAPTP